MRITLLEPTVDRDAFGKIIEMSNTRQAGDTGADQIPPGWRLEIFEVDFNGPPPARDLLLRGESVMARRRAGRLHFPRCQACT